MDNQQPIHRPLNKLTVSELHDGLITVDRFELSKTWYNLIIRLAARNPNLIEKAFIDMVYSKVVTIMKQKSDEELMQDMQDIVEAVNYAKLNIGIVEKGYYKK